MARVFYSANWMDPKPRVLVADDDQSIRQLICTIVAREHFEVDCVANGQEAIEQLQRQNYSVVLLDLMMPVLDGFGVIKYLRENPPPRKPIVIVITAYADQRFKDVDSGIVAGVMRKPFEIAELGNLVRSCVDGFEEATKAINAQRSIAEALNAEQRPN